MVRKIHSEVGIFPFGSAVLWYDVFHWRINSGPVSLGNVIRVFPLV